MLISHFIKACPNLSDKACKLANYLPVISKTFDVLFELLYIQCISDTLWLSPKLIRITLILIYHKRKYNLEKIICTNNYSTVLLHYIISTSFIGLKKFPVFWRFEGILIYYVTLRKERDLKHGSLILQKERFKRWSTTRISLDDINLQLHNNLSILYILIIFLSLKKRIRNYELVWKILRIYFFSFQVPFFVDGHTFPWISKNLKMFYEIPNISRDYRVFRGSLEYFQGFQTIPKDFKVNKHI